MFIFSNLLLIFIPNYPIYLIPMYANANKRTLKMEFQWPKDLKKLDTITDPINGPKS